MIGPGHELTDAELIGELERYEPDVDADPPLEPAERRELEGRLIRYWARAALGRYRGVGRG